LIPARKCINYATEIPELANLDLSFPALAIVQNKKSIYHGLRCCFSMTIIDGTLLAIVKRVNRV
jgi:hypothetical protein